MSHLFQSSELGNTVLLSSKHGQQYQCVLPKLENLDKKDEDIQHISKDEIPQLLEPIKKKCLYNVSAYMPSWNYLYIRIEKPSGVIIVIRKQFTRISVTFSINSFRWCCRWLCCKVNPKHKGLLEVLWVVVDCRYQAFIKIARFLGLISSHFRARYCCVGHHRLKPHTRPTLRVLK